MDCPWFFTIDRTHRVSGFSAASLFECQALSLYASSSFHKSAFIYRRRCWDVTDIYHHHECRTSAATVFCIWMYYTSCILYTSVFCIWMYKVCIMHNCILYLGVLYCVYYAQVYILFGCIIWCKLNTSEYFIWVYYTVYTIYIHKYTSTNVMLHLGKCMSDQGKCMEFPMGVKKKNGCMSQLSQLYVTPRVSSRLLNTCPETHIFRKMR